MVTIIDPHIKRDTGYHIHQEASAQALYVRNRDGGEFDGHCWPGSSSWVDFLDPKAREWWHQKISLQNYEVKKNYLSFFFLSFFSFLFFSFFSHAFLL